MSKTRNQDGGDVRQYEGLRNVGADIVYPLQLLGVLAADNARKRSALMLPTYTISPVTTVAASSNKSRTTIAPPAGLCPR